MAHADYEGGDPARVGKKGFLHWLIERLEEDIPIIEKHMTSDDKPVAKESIIHNLRLVVKKAKILRGREP